MRAAEGQVRTEPCCTRRHSRCFQSERKVRVLQDMREVELSGWACWPGSSPLALQRKSGPKIRRELWITLPRTDLSSAQCRSRSHSFHEHCFIELAH